MSFSGIIEVDPNTVGNQGKKWTKSQNTNFNKHLNRIEGLLDRTPVGERKFYELQLERLGQLLVEGVGESGEPIFKNQSEANKLIKGVLGRLLAACFANLHQHLDPVKASLETDDWSSETEDCNAAKRFYRENVALPSSIPHGIANEPAFTFLRQLGWKGKQSNAWKSVAEVLSKREDTTEKPPVVDGDEGDTGENPHETDSPTESDEKESHMSDEKKTQPKGAGIVESLGHGAYSIQLQWEANTLLQSYVHQHSTGRLLKQMQDMAKTSSPFTAAFEKGCFFNVEGSKDPFQVPEDSRMLAMIRQFAGAAQNNGWQADSPEMPEAVQKLADILVDGLFHHVMFAGSRIPEASLILRPADVEAQKEAFSKLEPKDFSYILDDIENDKDSEEERKQFLEKYCHAVKRNFEKLLNSGNPGAELCRLIVRASAVEEAANKDIADLGGESNEMERLYPLFHRSSGVSNSLIAQAFRKLDTQGEEVRSALGYLPANIYTYFSSVQAMYRLLTIKNRTATYQWNEAKCVAGLPGYQLVDESDKGHAMVAAQLVDELTRMRDKNGASPWPFSKDKKAVNRIVWDLIARMFNVAANKSNSAGDWKAEQMLCYEALTDARQMDLALNGKQLGTESGYIIAVGGTALLAGARGVGRWLSRPLGAALELTKAGYFSIARFCSEKNKANFTQRMKLAGAKAKHFSLQFIKAPYVLLCRTWDCLTSKARSAGSSVVNKVKEHFLNKRDDDFNVTSERESGLGLVWKIPVRIVTGACKLAWGTVSGIWGGICRFFGGKRKGAKLSSSS